MGIGKLNFLTGESYENGIIFFPLETKGWTDTGLPEEKWPQCTKFDTGNTCITAEVNTTQRLNSTGCGSGTFLARPVIADELPSVLNKILVNFFGLSKKILHMPTFHHRVTSYVTALGHRPKYFTWIVTYKVPFISNVSKPTLSAGA
jgi:hypothetical protein